MTSHEDGQTLRDLWHDRGLTARDVIAHVRVHEHVKMTAPTLYAMNRKEGGVSFAKVQAVCRVLGISLDEYARLTPCPHADEYKQLEKKRQDEHLQHL